MKVDRVFSFPTSVTSILNCPDFDSVAHVIHPQAKELYGAFEADFLFLETESVALPQATGFNWVTGATTTSGRDELCARVFETFDQLIDPRLWDLKIPEIIDFFWHRLDEETRLIKPSLLSPEYQEICDRPDAEKVCRYYMAQFSLDYLTEASPLTRALPGSFGELQMAIFKIVSDEYGNGDLEMKHSVLFQSTLTSLGMPTTVGAYRDQILSSVFLYMSYVNRVAQDKRLFFRFLGFLYVYEACLIFATQQQGLMLRSVFGPNTDTRYFDFHVEIDQGHGVWVVEKMLIPVVKKYGVDAARDILRGYHETSLLLLLCDWEMTRAVSANVHLKNWGPNHE